MPRPGPNGRNASSAGDSPSAALPPGPSAPGALQTLQWMTRPIALMERCRRRYGRIFSLRLGPAGHVFMIAEPEAARKVLTADRELFRAGDTNGIFKDVVGPSSILVLDGVEHMRHRKILLPVVGRHTHRYHELIAEIARRRVSSWQPGQTVHLLQEMEAISFEVIMRITFGSDGSSEREEQLRTLIPAMMDRCDSPLTLIPWFRRELGGLSPYARLMKFVGGIDCIILDAIGERRDDPLAQFGDDALSLFVCATYEDGSPLEESTIRDEVLTLLMAGYETTTSALTWALERLMRTPRVLAEVMAEIERGNSDQYLEALVKETLRIRPTIPIAARKALAPIELLGYELPRGSVLIVALYLLHRDPELYPDPEELRPERFLGGGAPPPWLPFGGGVRRCLGASLAQLEMKVVLRTVLEEVELRAADSRPEATVRRRFTLSPARKGAAVVERRRPLPASGTQRRRFVPTPTEMPEEDAVPSDR